MKKVNLKKIFAPALVLVALLLSLQVVNSQSRTSVERLINSCQQELQILCARLNEPRQAVICLRENEPQLFTRDCIEEMRLMNRERYNVPLPSEEPFRSPQESNEIQ